jgi:hypothetical protein
VTVPGDTVPVVGGRYLLAEPDYRFGAGPLSILVTRVIGPAAFGEDGRVEAWWEVEAYAKPPTYTGTGPRRHLYVRAACLGHARRRLI